MGADEVLIPGGSERRLLAEGWGLSSARHGAVSAILKGLVHCFESTGVYVGGEVSMFRG